MDATDLLSDLTVQELRRNLLYNPDTGEWIWLISQSNFIQAGRRAGNIVGGGYLQIRFKGVGYYSARLAWFYMTGEWPTDQIDHINRDRLDDRWINLRQATFGQNQANTGIPSNNTSGYKGVSWRKQSNKWEARVNNIYLGMFESIEDAKKARDDFVIKMHDEFAVTNIELKGSKS